jgi:hypothetical protein
VTLVVEKRAYRLELARNGLALVMSSPDGTDWLSLRLFAAVDAAEGADETLSVEPPRRDGDTIEVERRSTLWDRAGLTLRCGDDKLDVETWVEGRGRPTEVHLLGGRSLLPKPAMGFLPTGSRFRTLFTPTPADPVRLVRGASESAVAGVSGDGEAGRGHWHFTPAPLYFALTTADGVVDPAEPVAEGWLGLALAAPVEELAFVQMRYRPAEGGFSLLLDYEGQTSVDGAFRAPTIVLTPGARTPYEGLRRHRDDLAVRGVAPSAEPRDEPAWWNEPIFCGWGAQCALARDTGRFAGELATQANYDRFLAELEAGGVDPRTVVLDDKWQDAYGTNAPDPAKWPDLAGWIEGRHERGQKVLLWWKAWDPEGLPPELCVRAPDGRPVALDPSNPAARDELGRIVGRMLAPDGLDADGLKIDFTARTPSGQSLAKHGPGWGIALLHELLAVVYGAAKEAKPDALVITHTPHPSFVDVTDMIRLNDMINLGSGAVAPIVSQMRFRAEVSRAACPELPIDTDDWPVPDLESWRAYLAAKPTLGVPSLYYSSHLDATGESLEAEDYEALRRTWSDWRSRPRAVRA